jgi:hypothetical protein
MTQPQFTNGEIMALIVAVNIADRVDPTNPDNGYWLSALEKLLIAHAEE